MATEHFANVKSGPINGRTMYFRADAASIPLWSPVIVKAAASGYYIPEVATTTTAADPKIIGVACGPIADAANSYVSTAEGDSVRVCMWGLCKVKVDGNSDNLTDGDALVTKNSAGVAVKCAADSPASDTYVTATMNTALQHIHASFAMCLEASTTDGDIVPAFVYGARGTAT